jgi:hypothetical protein
MKKRISPNAFLKQWFPILLALATLACAQGCATYQVRTPDSDPVKDIYESETMHAFFWGLVKKPQVKSAKCEGEGINDVVIKRNYLQDLVSVVTIGIWMPTQIEHRCKAPHGDVGSFPEAPAAP